MSDRSAADFMEDQLKALLASPALARVAERHSETGGESGASEDSMSEENTQPNIHLQMLREAMQARLKQK